MNLTKAQLKDIAWHGGKALLCALQLFIFSAITKNSVGNLLGFLYTELIVREGDLAEVFLSLIVPATVIVLFAVVWRYYDNIDDRSFRRFCDLLPHQPDIFRNRHVSLSFPAVVSPRLCRHTDRKR